MAIVLAPGFITVPVVAGLIAAAVGIVVSRSPSNVDTPTKRRFVSRLVLLGCAGLAMEALLFAAVIAVKARAGDWMTVLVVGGLLLVACSGCVVLFRQSVRMGIGNGLERHGAWEAAAQARMDAFRATGVDPPIPGASTPVVGDDDEFADLLREQAELQANSEQRRARLRRDGWIGVAIALAVVLAVGVAIAFR
ncbi:MAG: hypothetical protein ACREO3_03475 [Arenimonas sp.]